MTATAKTQVLVFHPHLLTSKVNRTLAETCKDMPNVNIRDMYSLYPHGEINVAAEQQLLAKCERIVLQFPIYWYSVPPLLKQWFDDVLQYGWAYGSSGTVLHGKELLVAASFGASEESYGPQRFGYTADELLAPLHATSNLIGTTWGKPFFVFGALNLSAANLEAACQAYRSYLAV